MFLNQHTSPALRALRTERTNALEFDTETNAMALFGNAMDLYFGGDMEAAVALSGQVAGRIDEIKPVAEIIRRVRRRLPGHAGRPGGAVPGRQRDDGRSTATRAAPPRCSASLPWRRLLADASRAVDADASPVVRGFLGDRDVVGVALAEAGAGDADEPAALLELGDACRCRSSPWPAGGRRRAGTARWRAGPCRRPVPRCPRARACRCRPRRPGSSGPSRTTGPSWRPSSPCPGTP